MIDTWFSHQEKPPKWNILFKRFLHDDRVWNVYDYHGHHPDGREHDFFVINNRKDWIQCIALTANNEIVLVSQYRAGNDDITLELPGGGIDENEPVEHAAFRELREETGFAGNHPILLHSAYPNPATQTNRVYYYLLQNCKKIYDTQFDDVEDLRTHLLPLDQLDEVIDQGTFQSAITLAGILALQRWLRNSEKNSRRY